MHPTPEPLPPTRPPRPRWVYGLGLAIALGMVGAILFALALRTEVPVALENPEPPIVTPQAAPSDGEN